MIFRNDFRNDFSFKDADPHFGGRWNCEILLLALFANQADVTSDTEVLQGTADRDQRRAAAARARLRQLPRC